MKLKEIHYTDALQVFLSYGQKQFTSGLTNQISTADVYLGQDAAVT